MTHLSGHERTQLLLLRGDYHYRKATNWVRSIRERRHPICARKPAGSVSASILLIMPQIILASFRASGCSASTRTAMLLRNGLTKLEGDGFELVWGFSCQAVIFGFAGSSLFGAGGPFFIPSPAIRFAERAEGVKGPKR
jgi:hypothetical protein